MFCKNCGNKLEEEAKFCAKCGEKRAEIEETHVHEEAIPTQVSQGVPVQQVSNQKKSSTGLIVGVVLGVVGLLSLLVSGGILAVNLIVNKTEEKPPIDITDQVDPELISNNKQDVKFGKYQASIPGGADYDYDDSILMFLYEENYYEITVVTYNFNAIKENKEIFVGKQDNSSGVNITFDSAEVKNVDGEDYVVIYGKFGSEDLVSLFARSKAIPGYTIAVSCYGPTITEKEALRVSIPVINSLNISRSFEEGTTNAKFGFLGEMLEEIPEEETIE